MKFPQKLIVQQQVEMAEVFTGFETKNKYSIRDEQGQELLYAFEESGFMGRQFLGQMRSGNFRFIDKGKKTIFEVEKSFAFIFPKYSVKKEGHLIGDIKTGWTFLGHRLKICDSSGSERLLCRSRLPRIWTFRLLDHGRQVGCITKKWSGFGREAFSKADTFEVDFGTISDENLKKLVLACAIAIDMNAFERQKR